MPITLNGTTGITTPADTVTGNATVGGTLTVTGATTLTGAATLTGGIAGDVSATGTLAMGSSFKRNRIINGNMLIDQRYAGAQITAANLISGAYMVDRWQYYSSQASKFTAQQNAGAVTTAIGFPNYLGMTVASAVSVAASDYFSISQPIEGFNFADLGFGTASAKTVTLSFVVYSSLTGTFGGAFKNYGATRTYPFTYTISSANTWTTISITIAGDTSGTWVGASNAGCATVQFGLGAGSTYSTTAGAWAAGNYVSATGAVSVVGTSGATFYVTGVQLEVGTKATPYETQIYSDQLIQCQRYYEMSYDIGTVPGTATAVGTEFMFVSYNSASTIISAGNKAFFKVTKRIAPTTVTLYSTSTGTAGKIYDATASADITGNTLGIGMSGFSWYGSSTVNEVGPNFRVQWTATAEL